MKHYKEFIKNIQHNLEKKKKMIEIEKKKEESLKKSKP
jgi:hypothetical protein